MFLLACARKRRRSVRRFLASGVAAPGQSLAIESRAYELPFQVHFFQAAQLETPEAEHAFDDAKDGFDGAFAQSVKTPPFFALEAL